MAFTVYIHDKENQMLYALLKEPIITPRKNRDGKVKSWMASIEMEVSTPNNVMKKNRWLIPQSKIIEQEYPRNRKEKDIIDSFQKYQYPQGERIGYNKYIKIKEEYDNISGVNW